MGVPARRICTAEAHAAIRPARFNLLVEARTSKVIDRALSPAAVPVPENGPIAPGSQVEEASKGVPLVHGLSKRVLVELSEADADKWLPLLPALKLPESASAVTKTRTLAPGFQEALKIRQLQKRLTPDERALVAKKYEAGATADELAAEFGCHPTTVRSAVKAKGVAMRLAKTTTGQADEAVRLYRSGLSMVTVAERLGLSARTIFNIMRERGVATHHAHRRTRE